MTTLTLNSLHRVCQIVGRPYGVVSHAIESLDIKPAVLDDGAAKFTDEQVERIAEHLAAKQEAK